MPGRSLATLRRRSGPVSLLLGALLLGAGCGRPGDDLKLPGPDSTTAPLTRQQFTVQANEICRATTREIAERTERTGSANLDGSGGGDRQKLRETIEPVTTLALARLRNLTPPPADTALVRQGFDAMQALVDAAASDPTIPLDPVGLNRPEQFDYGLTGCFTKRT